MFSQSSVDSKFTRGQFTRCQEIQSIVQTGDIMLSSTNSLTYQAMRRLLNVNYDHLSVFLDKDNVIHISWPRVRMIHPLNLLSSIKDFKIVRPSFQNENERIVFLNILKSSINANYDFRQMFRGVTNKLKINYAQFPSKKIEWVDTKDLQLQKTQVCTDLIFYALSIGSPKFRTLLKDQLQFLDFRLVGSFTTDDLDIIINKSDFFKVIQEKQQINESVNTLPNLFKSVSSSAFIIGQTTNLNFGALMNSIKQTIWKNTSQLDCKSLLLLKDNAEKILVTYGLYSVFGLSQFEKAKGLILMYMFKKIPQKSRISNFSQIAFNVSELMRLLRDENKTFKTLQKIAFHFFMVVTMGILQGPHNLFTIEDKKKGLLQVAQTVLNFRGAKL